LRAFFFFADEGWSFLRRNPAASVAAVTAVGAVLFVLLLFMLLSHNVLILADRLSERKGLSVFLEADIGAERIGELRHRFESFGEVAEVLLVSRDEALREIEADLGTQDLAEVLEGNPLPDVFLVTPVSAASDASSLAQLAREMEAYEGVDDVLFGERWVAALDQGLQMLRRVNLLTGGLATLAIILVLGNTLRLLVLMREDHLAIMKVIGATDAFVRTPFVVAGVMLCIIGGGMSLALLRLGFAVTKGLMPGLRFLPLGFVLLFVLGVAVVGLLGSLLTVEASIRQMERGGGRLRA
jgi:cell division transport system permease protein